MFRQVERERTERVLNAGLTAHVDLLFKICGRFWNFLGGFCKDSTSRLSYRRRQRVRVCPTPGAAMSKFARKIVPLSLTLVYLIMMSSAAVAAPAIASLVFDPPLVTVGSSS